MRCQRIRDMFMDKIEGGLDPEQDAILYKHLSLCDKCREKFARYKRSWKLLEDFEDIEAAPGYVSRFWEELSSREAVVPGPASVFWRALAARRPLYRFALVAATVILLHISFTVYTDIKRTRAFLLSTSQEEMELFENFEIIQNLDALEEMNGFYNNGQEG